MKKSRFNPFLIALIAINFCSCETKNVEERTTE